MIEEQLHSEIEDRFGNYIADYLTTESRFINYNTFQVKRQDQRKSSPEIQLN